MHQCVYLQVPISVSCTDSACIPYAASVCILAESMHAPVGLSKLNQEILRLCPQVIPVWEGPGRVPGYQKACLPSVLLSVLFWPVRRAFQWHSTATGKLKESSWKCPEGRRGLPVGRVSGSPLCLLSLAVCVFQTCAPTSIFDAHHCASQGGPCPSVATAP